MTRTSAWSASKGGISHAHKRKSLAIKGLGDQSDPLRAKKTTGMDRDGVGEAVSAQNDGDTSVDNQSGRDREAVFQVEWPLCRHKSVYRHEIRVRALEPEKGRKGG